ncbi:MAG: 3-deoxy-D-manno-octulosonic acid transferase [Bacteroidetes bacterium]|nr:3-deoxy-D-manno-octulosonic acid transferase [Bacteroidota bacterium]
MRIGMRIAALFNSKIKLGVQGRQGIFDKIANAVSGNTEKRIWIHASSLGEFEQGRPIIEALKKEHPEYKIVLTFFSPSGYEIRKNYELADYVFYLPMDGVLNAKRFIKLINPSLAIFVKYEFWYHYLNQLKKNNIPTILISATFRSSQIFFQPYGGLFRKMLRCFNYLFVQEDASVKLLEKIGLTNGVIVSGDTRYDRVAEIAKQAKEFPLIQQYKDKHKLLIAGSTWPGDERVLKECLSSMPDDWKLVLAPHEIDNKHINQLKELFRNDVVCYSELPEKHTAHRVVLIDNIGMLSSLYRYGELAYIGGGFDKGGIHNILEPAIFGLPVFFGPTYQKFVEANQMVAHQYAFPVNNAAELKGWFEQLMSDSHRLQTIQNAIKSYMQQQTGATVKIMRIISAEILK